MLSIVHRLIFSSSDILRKELWQFKWPKPNNLFFHSV